MESSSIIERYGDLAAADEMYRITTAKLFVVDYERLWTDYEQLRPGNLALRNPELRSLPEPARTKVVRGITEQWLLENAGLISKAQLANTSANTEISTKCPPRTVYRPPRYGRACIAPVRATVLSVDGLRDAVSVAGGGELDLKGVGVGPGRSPARGDHSDGLMTLENALQEYVVERLLSAILTHAGATVRTLPHYAILDTGFDGFTSAGEQFPAGVVVRRAHLRGLESDLPRWDTAHQYLVFSIELLLRRYGITSAGGHVFRIRRHGDKLVAYTWGRPTQDPHDLLNLLVERLRIRLPFEADRVNIQMDIDDQGTEPGRQLLDFGQYRARRTFDRAVISLVCDRPMGWGGVLMPGDAGFVQPEPALVPTGRRWDEVSRPQADLFGELASEMVAAYRCGALDHHGVYRQTAALLDELTSRWP